ncbi:MAG: hypothetical protein PHX61_02655 [Alphaproteobacteria bacterium]|nr:hypothetical protein [Alphaproteobacteria bacterium]
MTIYLDREAVLKEIEKRRDFDEETYELKRKIEHGGFDAPQIPMGIDHLGLMKILADKDAEIARLKEDKVDCVRDRNIQYWGLLHRKDRIAELEKLCDMQKATIDAQGKKIRAYNNFRQRLPSVDPARIVITTKDAVKEHCAFEGILPQPAQKAPEPELFICPNATTCRILKCFHNTPHKYEDASCNSTGNCPWKTGPCTPVKSSIPQPSPVPTSGTGTAPEGATVEEAISRPIEKCEDCHHFLDVCTNGKPAPKCGRSARPDVISENERKSFPRWCPLQIQDTYLGMAPEVQYGHIEAICDRLETLENGVPGMARDIGNLALRMDQLEQLKRKSDIKRKIDFNRLNVHADQISELQTALKSLQEEIKNIPNKVTCSK